MPRLHQPYGYSANRSNRTAKERSADIDAVDSNKVLIITDDGSPTSQEKNEAAFYETNVMRQRSLSSSQQADFDETSSLASEFDDSIIGATHFGAEVNTAGENSVKSTQRKGTLRLRQRTAEDSNSEVHSDLTATTDNSFSENYLDHDSGNNTLYSRSTRNNVRSSQDANKKQGSFLEALAVLFGVIRLENDGADDVDMIKEKIRNSKEKVRRASASLQQKSKIITSSPSKILSNFGRLFFESTAHFASDPSDQSTKSANFSKPHSNRSQSPQSARNTRQSSRRRSTHANSKLTEALSIEARHLLPGFTGSVISENSATIEENRDTEKRDSPVKGVEFNNSGPNPYSSFLAANEISVTDSALCSTSGLTFSRKMNEHANMDKSNSLKTKMRPALSFFNMLACMSVNFLVANYFVVAAIVLYPNVAVQFMPDSLFQVSYAGLLMFLSVITQVFTQGIKERSDRYFDRRRKRTAFLSLAVFVAVKALAICFLIVYYFEAVKASETARDYPIVVYLMIIGFCYGVFLFGLSGTVLFFARLSRFSQFV